MPTALVTGATAGIGAAFAVHLATQGYDLVLVARGTDRLQERRATLLTLGAPTVELITADLTHAADREEVAERLARPGAPVDLLVNNAGIGLGKEFLESTPDDLQRQIDLNVTAVVRLTHAVLPGMVQRGHGGVINVASIAGLVAGRGTTYAGSKAFVVSLSEGLSMSLRGTGVRVQALCPGFVRTEFHDRAGIDMTKTPDALYVDIDLVVRTSLDDLRHDRPLSIPGPLYKVIATLSRLAPRGLVRSVAAKVNNKGRT
ncbi:SDR family NAD(P)-dependent oxidoreductase [Nakamurella sp. YIM 132087]|uniref:SDR family NAD(P)-dependent oxidoreductase n=1 Tax=Nakamurella alba TaxID=2665158 RepID=A0A7K1FPI9_9ACTN|nr:SDR family oxidoreductase [Nakamurella alba]MTD16000.1 SDR family NAD(P)-dependent oxidoreductase [Nakamurella alba]